MCEEIENVLLGDAASGTGAGDLSEINVVLAGEFADKRGGADVRFVVVFLSRCGRGGHWGRRSGRFFHCGGRWGRGLGGS